MTKEELVELYLDWAYGRDEDVTMSDVIIACLDSHVEYDEIEKMGREKSIVYGL